MEPAVNGKVPYLNELVVLPNHATIEKGMFDKSQDETGQILLRFVHLACWKSITLKSITLDPLFEESPGASAF